MSLLFGEAPDLEGYAQAELDPAAAGQTVSWHRLRGDHAKGGRIGHVHERGAAAHPGIGEGNVVEHVEEVGGNLQPEAFGNGRRFANAEVLVPGTETAQGIAAAAGGVRGERDWTEHAVGGAGIRKVVESGGRAASASRLARAEARRGRTGHAAVQAGSEGTRAGRGDFIHVVRGNDASAESETALRGDQGHATAGRKYRSDASRRSRD